MSSVPKLCGVYGIVHRATGRTYIGSSRDVPGRWKSHAYKLAHGQHHASALQILWRAEGPEAFAFVVLERCHLEDLPIREQAWLDSFESVLNASPLAWNPNLDPAIAARGAAKRVGRIVSAETREKIRCAVLAAHARGAYPSCKSMEFKQRVSKSLKLAFAEGRHTREVALETRAKISATLTGHVSHSLEAREKIAAGTRAGIARARAAGSVWWSDRGSRNGVAS